MKKIILLLASVSVLTAGCENLKLSVAKEAGVVIGKQKIRVEVADSLPEQIQGLSDRTDLCENCGMLFIYPQAKVQNFWMNQMNFPLDIVWINEERVTGIEAEVPIYDARGGVSRVNSGQPVKYVLEVEAGFMAKAGLKVGDTVQFLNLD